MKLFIETIGWRNMGGMKIKVWDKNPIDNEPIEMFNRQTQAYASHNRHVFCVEYNNIVEKIYDVEDGEEFSKFPYQENPEKQIYVGQKLPDDIYNNV